MGGIGRGGEEEGSGVVPVDELDRLTCERGREIIGLVHDRLAAQDRIAPVVLGLARPQVGYDLGSGSRRSGRDVVMPLPQETEELLEPAAERVVRWMGAEM